MFPVIPMNDRPAAWSWWLLVAALILGFHPVLKANHPNVLFLAVDDLRPELGCYGHPRVQSPNLDRLAREGILFERSYCQVPVCGASRASLLTGLRPTRSRFLDYDTWAEKDAPNTPTLPEHFKHHGYRTLSLGKVFHHLTDASRSWSEPAWRPRPQGSRGNWRDYVSAENIAEAEANGGKGPPFEQADVGDEAYQDGRIAERAIAELRRLKQVPQPFFLAVGFLKPHLPFNAPSRYWAWYPPESIQLPSNYLPPENVPLAALHNWGELRGYAQVPAQGPLPDALARTLIRGYYASVSYTDALIGKVLKVLDQLGLRDNTIVILWGDHGWNLGDHSLWCKHCNFESALRAPLLLSAPGLPQNQRTEALTEFVDIYPTLCELAGLPLPSHLQGASLLPLLRDPKAGGKSAVFSRWQKGDSVRTDRYRYTEWTDDGGRRSARMLYDHLEDPKETRNLAVQPEFDGLMQNLSRLLRAQQASIP